MKNYMMEADALRELGIPLQDWKGNELTEEGFLAKVQLSLLSKLLKKAPYSYLVPIFSLQNLKFIIAPLRVRKRKVTLETPTRTLKITWPLERVFDFTGKEILEGKTPKEFLFLSGVRPHTSGVYLYQEINLPQYHTFSEEIGSVIWMAENNISILKGIQVLRESLIRHAAIKVILDLEEDELVWKIAQTINWRKNPKKFIDLLQSIHNDFAISDLLLREECS